MGESQNKNELKLRNISIYNINLGLKEIDDQDYINKFEDIFNKKLSSLSNINSNLKRKKIISYLLYRGWESNLIFSKVNEI